MAGSGPAIGFAAGQPGVRVDSSSCVNRAVVLHNSLVSRHALVENAILDKNVVVQEGATVGVDKNHDRARGLVVSSGDPPETSQTVQRLAGLGYGWHNVMHLVMGPVTEAVYETLAEKRPFDRADYMRRLAELPGDWPPPEELGPR